MKSWRVAPWILWGVILFLGAVPVLAGEQAKGVVKLYTSWPMQGAMIPEGTAMKRAVDLAVEHAGSMVAGYRIEVVNLDDASPVTGSWDGTVEAENAQKAIADADAMVYIATYNSGAAKVSMPITNKAGMAQVTVANTYPGLTKPRNAPGEPGIYRPTGQVNYFRAHPSDDIQGAAAAKLAECLGFKRVFILDDRQLYGKGIADVFAKTAKELGLQVVGHEGVESVDIDFRALLTKVRAVNPNLVYGGFVIDSGGPQVIQQMKALGLFDAGVKFMGPDGLFSPALVEQATPAAVNNNVYVTFAGLPSDQLPTEVGKRFYADYKAKYKEEPIGWAMYAYQATIVTVDAMKRAGAKDRARILDALRQTKNFEGITGRFSFDENGDTDRTDMGGFQVKDSKFQFVGLISKDKCP
ncbi:MAG: branched-chain amino acid ABC transporter substrate-binding protein [Planctomycetaceae bacterium]|jgi:branched-chain amino acid transport system substrate-binding protein|nr:MAG: branched-chain amino acid ABC transporter substrate-binding protein [Planctomycetaceae bacterium]